MRRIPIDPDREAADDTVRNLQFSPDGKLLGGVLGLPGHEDGRAWRYDLTRDHPLPNPDDDDYEVERMAHAPDPYWSADLELLAEWLIDESGFPGLRLTDLWSRPREVVWLLSNEVNRLHPETFAFAPDGEFLYAGCRTVPGYVVLRWPVEPLFAARGESAGFEDELTSDPKASLHALATSANSPWLAAATDGAGIDLIDPTGERSRRRLRPRHAQNGPAYERLQFSPRGDLLLALTPRRGDLSVWDIAREMETAHVAVRDISAAAFRHDGRLLAVTRHGDVLTYDATLAELSRLDFGVGPLHGVAVAPDGLTAAVGAAGGQVVLFDLD